MMYQKTKKLLVVLLSVCLMACCGILLVSNVNKVNAATPTTFAMKQGAYVRVDSSYSDNGIRFIAEISKAEYEGLGEGATEGVFIMPDYYLDDYGMLNQANTFDGTTYTWDGKADTTGTKIIHLPTKAVLKDDVYEIKGSVVDLKVANLNLDYVAQAYIKDSAGNYYFAEDNIAALKDNARSIVTISQTALIKGGASATQETNLKGYINTYIGEQPNDVINKNVNVNVLVENSTGTYTKNNSLSSTDSLVIDSAEDLITAYTVENTEKAGYRFASGISNASEYPTINGDVNLNLYYERNSFEGFDDTPVDNMIISSANNGENGIMAAHGFTTTSIGKSPDIRQYSVYGETGVYINVTTSDSWIGYTATTPVQLPFAMKTFSAVIYTVHNSRINNGTEPIQIAFNNSSSYLANITLPEEGTAQRIFFTLTNSISEVNKIEFRNDGGGSAAKGTCGYIFDSFRWECDLLSTAQDVYATESDTTVDVELGSSFASTKYSAQELAGMVGLSYIGANGVETQVPTGSTQLNVVENSYVVNYSMNDSVVSSYKIFGYYPNYVTSFDKATETAAEYTNPLKLNYEAGALLNTTTIGQYFVEADGVDNTPSRKINTVYGDWCALKFANSNLTGYNITKVCMWVYATSDKTFNDGAGNCYLKPASLNNGTNLPFISIKANQWNYVEFSFDAQSDLGADIELRVSQTANVSFSGCSIDRITLK